MPRRAVEQDQRRAHGQPGDEVVPHHPAGGGEPEEAVSRTEVVVQRQHLEVLQQDAAVPVDDRLGQPGGSRRVEDVQRVVEGDLLELAERPALGHQIGPGEVAGHRRIGVEVGEDDGRLQRRAAQRGWPPAPRGGRPPRRRSGSRRPPAGPAARTWPSRSTTLRTPNSGAHEVQVAPRLAVASSADHRLRHVRQVGGHAVAAADPQPLQPGARPRDRLPQLAAR